MEPKEPKIIETSECVREDGVKVDRIVFEGSILDFGDDPLSEPATPPAPPWLRLECGCEVRIERDPHTGVGFDVHLHGDSCAMDRPYWNGREVLANADRIMRDKAAAPGLSRPAAYVVKLGADTFLRTADTGRIGNRWTKDPGMAKRYPQDATGHALATHAQQQWGGAVVPVEAT